VGKTWLSEIPTRIICDFGRSKQSEEQVGGPSWEEGKGQLSFLEWILGPIIWGRTLKWEKIVEFACP
jgi:hypothetical protein